MGSTVFVDQAMAAMLPAGREFIRLYEAFEDDKRLFVLFLQTHRGRGLILCDDCRFVTCPGEAKAMDSFFADRREEIFSLPPGQGLVVKGWP